MMKVFCFASGARSFVQGWHIVFFDVTANGYHVTANGYHVTPNGQ
jgi:hypothetical protein